MKREHLKLPIMTTAQLRNRVGQLGDMVASLLAEKTSLEQQLKEAHSRPVYGSAKTRKMNPWNLFRKTNRLRFREMVELAHTNGPPITEGI